VEGVLTDELNHVLVSGDTGGFQGFGGDLLLLERDHMNDGGELVNGGFLLTSIVDSNLRIGDTSVVSGLGVGLSLALSVTSGGSSSHFFF